LEKTLKKILGMPNTITGIDPRQKNWHDEGNLAHAKRMGLRKEKAALPV
jgi:hypothetical protein